MASARVLPNPPMSPDAFETDQAQLQELEQLGFACDDVDWDSPAQSNEMYPDDFILFGKTYHVNEATRYRPRTLVDNAITWLLSKLLGCDTTTPYEPAESLESTAREAHWISLHWWIRAFSVLVFATIALGIGLAHVFIIFGYAWTDCLVPPEHPQPELLGVFTSGAFRIAWPCVLTFHLMEVPFTLYCGYVAYYGLFKLRNNGPLSNLEWYRSLLRWLVVVNASYFCIESLSLMTLVTGQSLLRADPLTVPEWEALKPVVPLQTIGLILVAICMFSGVAIGLYIEYLLVQYLNPAPSPLYWYPGDESQLRSLVKWAGATSRRLRCVGSSHSVYASIHVTPSFLASGANFDLEVGMKYYKRLRMFHPLNESGHMDTSRLWVEAQGGIYLGKNTNDADSTWENSLCGLLSKITVGRDRTGARTRGLSLPDLGGITHQTVSGFVSTASAGGSTVHDLYAAIRQVRFVDGNGRIVTLTRPADAATIETDPLKVMQHPFYAMIGSVGLLGAISTVTFEFDLEHDGDKQAGFGSLAYWGVGRQDVVPVDIARSRQGSVDAVSACVNGKTIKLTSTATSGVPLRTWLRETPYSRLLYWPQAAPERLSVWQCVPVTEKPGKIERFEPIVASRIGTAILEGAYGDAYRLASHARLPWPAPLRKMITGVVNLGQSFGTKTFADIWYRALPMDNAIDDSLMPTEFTELWVPLSQCDAVMDTLFKYLAGDVGWSRKGSFPIEIYAATASPFWMSPAFGTGEPVVRIDLFWFKDHFTDPAVFYRQYWQLFLSDTGLDVRFHLGKHMPLLLQRLIWLDAVQRRGALVSPWKSVWIEKSPDNEHGQWCIVAQPSGYGKAYQIPTWLAGQRRFEQLRRLCDPNNVFPNQYWEERLPLVNVNRDYAALGDWDITLTRMALDWNAHESPWLSAVTEFLDLATTIQAIKDKANQINSVPSVYKSRPHITMDPIVRRRTDSRHVPAPGLRMRGPVRVA